MFGNCFRTWCQNWVWYFWCCMQSGHTLRFLTTVFSSYRSHQATLQQLFKDYLFAHLCTAYRLWRQCVRRVLWRENELDEVFVGNIWASTVYQGQHGISISLSTKKGAKHLQDCNGTVLWSISCCQPWKRQFESRRCKASPYLSNFWLFTTFQTSNVHQAY